MWAVCILIIGAAPAGLTAALERARRGTTVRIGDKLAAGAKDRARPRSTSAECSQSRAGELNGRHGPLAIVGSVSHRMIERRLVGRVALIGDAAHIHSPAGGRGMNLGIEDATSFASALVERTLGDCDVKRLARARTVLKGPDHMQTVVTLKGGLFQTALINLVSALLQIPCLQKRLV